MTENDLPHVGGASFEGLKKTNDHGAEYWSARDLQPLLGYTQWRSFEKSIQKAITSCEQSGNDPAHHFARARKVILLGKRGIGQRAAGIALQDGLNMIPRVLEAAERLRKVTSK